MGLRHARRGPDRRSLTLACGRAGLRHRRACDGANAQDRGWTVTIYASALPPKTTSNIAGAQWTPTTVFALPQVTPAFLDTFRKASRIANRTFQLMAGDTYGVRWIDNYVLKQDPAAPAGELHYAESVGIADLYADVETIDPASVPFTGFKSIQRFATMLMEPNTFLPAVERDFLLRGGRIVVRTFNSTADIASLHEPVIFNCTGLGSRALFDDTELEPVRGQLSILEPQPEVDYCYLSGTIYMFPRNDGVVLGERSIAATGRPSPTWRRSRALSPNTRRSLARKASCGRALDIRSFYRTAR